MKKIIYYLDYKIISIENQIENEYINTLKYSSLDLGLKWYKFLKTIILNEKSRIKTGN